MGSYIILGLDHMLDLMQNAILLFALVFIYEATNFHPQTHQFKRKVVAGIIIGLCSILIMMVPWNFVEGIFFDSRSILLGITGIFFGPVVASIAATMALTYRISIGGAGVYAGVLTIVFSTLFGLSWHKIKPYLPNMKPFIEYYVFGLIIHIVTFSFFLTLPSAIRMTIIVNNLIPFIGIFPFITAFLAIIIINQRFRLESKDKIREQGRLLQASIDSAKSMEIYAIDLNSNYLSFNEYHKQVVKKLYKVEIQLGDSTLKLFDSDDVRKIYKTHVDAALRGETINVVVESTHSKGMYFERLYEPILNDKGEVIGVTIFSQDITQEKQHEQAILFVSYHDVLTELKNRRYFQEQLIKYNKAEYLPLTILISDINGLKVMNDAFGHDVGDDLLRRVANVIKSYLPKSVELCRTGGDEFIALFPNTDELIVQRIKEDINKQFSQESLKGMVISVSFGIASKTEEHTAISLVMKHAEDTMYRHKLFEVASHRSASIKTILNTLRAKNPNEEAHSLRVSRLCTEIGNELKMNTDQLNLLSNISNLHDIGKIAIDQSILNKPGKLTDEEWEIIKRHPELGYRIVLTSPDYAEIAEDILSHHERYDGKGYPRGLQGDEIPIRARIISLCDAYDAMTSDRPYRKAMEHHEAIEEIIKHRGTQFDPKIVDIFLTLYQDGIN